MTDRQTQSESVRDTMRQREDEQHGGIISDSVKGLGRNAEVWHTRMWNCSGLVSLSPPPLPLLFSAGTDHSLQSHHSPASDSLSPLSLSLSFWHICITAYLTKLTHRGVQWVVQLEHDPISMDYPPWMMQQSKFDGFFSGWLEIMNIVFFPDEVFVLYNSVKTYIYRLTHQPSMLSVMWKMW